MNTFYNYFLVSHLIIFLLIYALVYCCLTKYLTSLGTLLKGIESYQNGGVGGYANRENYHFYLLID